MDYLIELEINEADQEILKYLIDEKLIDYVVMDIKHDFNFEKWHGITGKVLIKKNFFKNIKKSR